MRLGLIEPPPPPDRVESEGTQPQPTTQAAGPQTAQPLEPPPPASPEESEWFELRPRWPLTMERHPSCMPSDKLRSAKKARQHMSLAEMTLLELEALKRAETQIRGP